jgi:hypothetical protein
VDSATALLPFNVVEKGRTGAGAVNGAADAATDDVSSAAAAVLAISLFKATIYPLVPNLYTHWLFAAVPQNLTSFNHRTLAFRYFSINSIEKLPTANIDSTVGQALQMLAQIARD